MERNSELHAEAANRLAERIAEEQEATRRASEEAAERIEMASATAARQHRDSIANSWRLEARAKAERAYELYQANLYSEANALARQAFQQDPGNLSAYKTASWSLEALGDHASAHSLYKKQLSLLATPDYRESAKAFGSVLAGLPGKEESLLASSRDLFHRLAHSWKLNDDVNYVLEQLIRKGWREEAALLVELLSTKLPSDLDPLLVTLVKAGYLEETRQFARSAATQRPSIWLNGWALELAGDPPTQEIADLDAWLARISAGDRDQVRRELLAVTSRKPALSTRTLSLLREAVARRRRTWEPDIINEFSRQAAVPADSNEELNRYWKTSTFRISPGRCFFLLAGLFLPLILARAFLPDDIAPIFFGAWTFLAGVLAVITFFLLKHKLRSEVYQASYVARWNEENRQWQAAMTPETSG